MVVVVICNMWLTGGHQLLMLLNLALSLTMLDCRLGIKWMGELWVRIAYEVIRVLVYCANFVAIYKLVTKDENYYGEN